MIDEFLQLEIIAQLYLKYQHGHNAKSYNFHVIRNNSKNNNITGDSYHHKTIYVPIEFTFETKTSNQ